MYICVFFFKINKSSEKKLTFPQERQILLYTGTLILQNSSCVFISSSVRFRSKKSPHLVHCISAFSVCDVSSVYQMVMKYIYFFNYFFDWFVIIYFVFFLETYLIHKVFVVRSFEEIHWFISSVIHPAEVFCRDCVPFASFTLNIRVCYRHLLRLE